MIGGLVTTDGQEPGLFCEPTLLHHCSTDMRVVQEQIHAPVLCSMVVHDDREFINEVNETKFSTGLRIFTCQPDRYADLEKFLDVGFVGYNVGSMMDKNLPI
jgi:acyl-CoA reductase-like NAD-dependent aldehyde dehydrogenase